MSDSVIYFSIAITAIFVLVHLWAVISVFRSDKNVGTKTLWALLIWIFPIIGLVIWGIAGPRSHGEGPTTPERSK